MPVESALKIGALDLPAGQGHGLEDPLVPEGRFLIEFFDYRTAIACVLVIRIRVFLHKSPRTRLAYGRSRNYPSNTFVVSLRRGDEEIGWRP